MTFGGGVGDLIIDGVKSVCAKGSLCGFRGDSNAQDASVIGTFHSCRSPLHEMRSEGGEECGARYCGQPRCS